MSRQAWNPVTLEVFKNLFYSIAEEMGVTLRRTSFSPNIKERLDYSCAVFDAHGRTIAQGEHMPVHLGSLPLSVRAAIDATAMNPGDMVVLNDPFRGGTHLPDITLVCPVFIDAGSAPTFFVANRAHHSDVGGLTPGSMPLSRSIDEEGVRIAPAKLLRDGRIDPVVMDSILTSVRTPEEREGDLAAQIAANRTGERRVEALVARYGKEITAEYASHLQDYAEEMTRAAISAIPDGDYSFEDFMDDDGQGNVDLPIRVTVTIKGDSATIDFEGTCNQVEGCINAVYAITLSAVVYCFRLLVPFPIPANDGIERPLRVTAPEGSLVNALPPAAVAGGNVETSQRIVDVVLGALSKAIPHRIPAASSGTMNNLTIGGIDPRTGETYAYYETLAGGMGARPGADGLDATHTHMTNSLNTPVEALEHAYPFRVERYLVRRGTGGNGEYRGGDGLQRDVTVLGEAVITVLSDRRIHRPWGLQGGEAGAPGENVMIELDRESALPSKFSTRSAPGATISIRTPGGGGFGSPVGGSRPNGHLS